MKFGVEIECWSPLPVQSLVSWLKEEGFSGVSENKSRKEWAVVLDHSLTDEYCPTGFFGVEVVSPILNTKTPKDLEKLAKLCAALQRLGCVVEGRCGLHVHLDARGMSLGRVKRIFQRYTVAEPYIDSFFAANRRKANQFALAGKGILKDVLASTDFDDLDCRLHERYRKVNLCALGDHGTIEFRQHEGTINGLTILSWVGFLVGFVQATKVSKEAIAETKKGSFRYRLFCAIHKRVVPVTADELAKELGCAASTVLWHARRLQSQGLVKKAYGSNGFSSCRKEEEEAAEELADVPPLSIWEGVEPQVKAQLLDKSMLLAAGSRITLEKLLGAKA